MRRFVKGTLETVVGDNDRRIPAYLSSGWKEQKPLEKPQDEAGRKMHKAIADANASEAEGTRKRTAADKKVNDAIKASTVADAESEAIDDGLIKTGGNA